MGPLTAGIMAGGSLLAGLMQSRSVSQSNRKDREFSKLMYRKQLRDSLAQYARERQHGREDYVWQTNLDRKNAWSDYTKSALYDQGIRRQDLNYEIQAQHEASKALTQDQFQWMVEGAQKAGINPLTAMGVGPVQSGSAMASGNAALSTPGAALSQPGAYMPTFQYNSSAPEPGIGGALGDAVQTFAGLYEDPITREGRQLQNDLTQKRIQSLNNEALRFGQSVPQMRSTESETRGAGGQAGGQPLSPRTNILGGPINPSSFDPEDATISSGRYAGRQIRRGNDGTLYMSTPATPRENLEASHDELTSNIQGFYEWVSQGYNRTMYDFDKGDWVILPTKFEESRNEFSKQYWQRWSEIAEDMERDYPRSTRNPHYDELSYTRRKKRPGSLGGT
jgi:hypothetical protein